MGTAAAPWADTSKDPELRKAAHDDWFYLDAPPVIPPETQELLQKYSNIPPGDIVPHAQAMREKAYKIHHYPCIGLYRFLHLALSKHPFYQAKVLSRLTSPNATDLFLDVGTCFGQDIRKLVYDGVPPALIYGTDLLPEFIDSGYELFRDRDRIPDDHFIRPADLFDKRELDAFSVLDGKMTIIHLNSVFHLFTYADQLHVAKRLLRLLRPGPGTLILGQHNANTKSGDYPQRIGSRGDSIYRHNENSWAEFWERVGEEVGQQEGKEPVKFKVESKLSPHEKREGMNVTPENAHWMDPGFSRMWFTVERL